MVDGPAINDSYVESKIFSPFRAKSSLFLFFFVLDAIPLISLGLLSYNVSFFSGYSRNLTCVIFG